MQTVIPNQGFHGKRGVRRKMPKWFLIALSIICFNSLADDVTGTANRCSDLSGQYAFWGDWKRLDLEVSDAQSAAAYRAANRQPRFDFHALAIGANQVLKPERAVLHQDLSLGTLTVDIEGEGVDERRKGFSVKLPAEIDIHCGENGWQRDKKMEGGGENVRSTTLINLVLRKDASGDLVVEGRKETYVGWLFKKRYVEQWSARFRQVKI